MEQLIEQSQRLIRSVSLDFKRYLADEIKWSNRLIGIKGSRGTGKTTLLLQWLKGMNKAPEKAAYFSLDDLYFTTHSLKETIREFYQQGGEVLVLDEVHKYEDWAREIKNAYDFFPELQIVFTGSSIIDLSKQTADLSRRALMYELHGLSFREYLILQGIYKGKPYSIQEIILEGQAVSKEILSKLKPFEHFQKYLKYGYYPFGLEDITTIHQRIHQLVRTIVEVDMAEIRELDIRNAKKLLQLIYVIAQQVPFKPNLTALAEKTGIHRNSLNNYLLHLEQAKILQLLYVSGISVATLQKPEKVFLNNTTLLYALSDGVPDLGTVRETFFLSQIMVNHKVNAPAKGDFLIDNQYTFEVGGKAKSPKQIFGLENAFIVKDDIETPVMKSIPLWMFGFLY